MGKFIPSRTCMVAGSENATGSKGGTSVKRPHEPTLGDSTDSLRLRARIDRGATLGGGGVGYGTLSLPNDGWRVNLYGDC